MAHLPREPLTADEFRQAAAILAGKPDGLALITQFIPIRSEAESGRDYDWPPSEAGKWSAPTRSTDMAPMLSYMLVPRRKLPGGDGSIDTAIRCVHQ